MNSYCFYRSFLLRLYEFREFLDFCDTFSKFSSNSQRKLKFIEDSAHALGSEYSEKIKCGGIGDLSVLSFTPHKIITMGQGGMILTNNSKKFKYLNDLKTFNRKIDKVDWYKGFGLNFKITDLFYDCNTNIYENQ